MIFDFLKFTIKLMLETETDFYRSHAWYCVTQDVDQLLKNADV